MQIYRKICLLLLLASAIGAWSQRATVSTNALYWLTATPNVAMQFRTSRLTSVQMEVMGRYKPGLMGHNLRFVGFSPEVRFWPEQVGLQRFYVGMMAQTAIYDARWASGDTHKGGIIGFGPSFGFDWIVGKHWNIELSTGLGCVLLRDRKNYAEHHTTHLYPAPLRLGVNVVYILK